MNIYEAHWPVKQKQHFYPQESFIVETSQLATAVTVLGIIKIDHLAMTFLFCQSLQVY